MNACESTPLVHPRQPQLNVKKKDNFWLKDDVYSLADMFGAAKCLKQALADHFVGGTVYQAYLSALNYHRWHSPVDAVIEDMYDIPGTYYLDQSQFIPYDETASNNSHRCRHQKSDRPQCLKYTNRQDSDSLRRDG